MTGRSAFSLFLRPIPPFSSLTCILERSQLFDIQRINMGAMFARKLDVNAQYIQLVFELKPIPRSPFPRKMVKFNRCLSQILRKVFVSKNMSLELTKYCFVFTPRLNDDNTKCYSKQCIGR